MEYIGYNSIASGSKGNCSIIWDDQDLLIFDFGISLKSFKKRISELKIDALNKSLFISHEHSDHTKGVGSLVKHGHVDVYSTGETLEAIRLSNGYPIYGKIALGNFKITPVKISHDAVNPVAFVVSYGHYKISIVSDLGIVSQELISETKGSKIVSFESNHDVEMLKSGRYPDQLKKRILSDHGHLSNEQAAEALSKIVDRDTEIVLAHLSQENNRPDIAMDCTRSYLKNRNIEFGSLEFASQESGSTLHLIDML
ncbi:MAG: MBL fold metallo-hydrolase [Thermoplasmatales archaeon]|nr:MBL fold metallo-hydrolase [Thermoplasmatales archaeon]MCW6170000.1 MBL fold metallo-hydrolase [Thermoplasmatales archaeon]